MVTNKSLKQLNDERKELLQKIDLLNDKKILCSKKIKSYTYAGQTNNEIIFNNESAPKFDFKNFENKEKSKNINFNDFSKNKKEVEKIKVVPAIPKEINTVKKTLDSAEKMDLKVEEQKSEEKLGKLFYIISGLSGALLIAAIAVIMAGIITSWFTII